MRLVARIPRRWLAAIGAALGALLWALGIRRRVALANLALAFPEKSEAERREIGRRTYRRLGESVFDFLRIPDLSQEEIDRIFVYDPESWENFVKARDRGKGVVACTAHFGNFEVLAAAHNRRGVLITTISRGMRGGTQGDALWTATRKRSGVEELVIRRGQTLKAAVAALKSGRVLGYVIDQSEPSRNAVFPTFFGVPCATSPTPAFLGWRTGAATIFILSVPLPDGRHRVIVEGPLDPPDTGDRERDALAFMQDLNDRLERWVRAHPDQWYWLHRRWKRRAPKVSGARAPPPAGLERIP
jgi:KDO2-lipid IV(A) lauroyltransferase